MICINKSNGILIEMTDNNTLRKILASNRPITVEDIPIGLLILHAPLCHTNYKEIPQKDLILYTHLPYKSRRFFELLKELKTGVKPKKFGVKPKKCNPCFSLPEIV